MCRSAATVVMWSLVKSLPWSTYRTLGKPCTAQAGSLLRQIAWRSARDRFNAEGAPRKTLYPATAREQSSRTTVSQGLAG